MNLKKLAVLSLASTTVLGTFQTVGLAQTSKPEEAVVKAKKTVEDAEKNLKEIMDSRNPQAMNWKKDAERRVSTAKETLKQAEAELAKVTSLREAVANAKEEQKKAQALLDEINSSSNSQAQLWKKDAERRVTEAKAKFDKATQALEAATGEKSEGAGTVVAPTKSEEPAAKQDGMVMPAPTSAQEEPVNEEKLAEDKYQKDSEKEYENLTQPDVSSQPNLKQDEMVVPTPATIESDTVNEEKIIEDKYQEAAQKEYEKLAQANISSQSSSGSQSVEMTGASYGRFGSAYEDYYRMVTPSRPSQPVLPEVASSSAETQSVTPDTEMTGTSYGRFGSAYEDYYHVVTPSRPNQPVSSATPDNDMTEAGHGRFGYAFERYNR